MKPTYQTVGGNRGLHTATVARASRLQRGALLFLALATAGIAFAQDPVDAAIEPVDAIEAPVDAIESPAEPPEEALPTDPAALLDLARLRFETGDAEGMRIVVLEALEQPGVDVDAASYLLGLAWEFGGDPAQALALYDEGLARWPDSARAPDRAYRRAEAFAKLGRPADALEALDAVRAYPMDAEDARRVALCEATWTIEAGDPRHGIVMLRDALEGVGPDEMPWAQARARAVLARWLAAEAAALDLDAPEKKVVARLEERVALVGRIEKEAAAVARLDEPEWVIDAVLTLGGAYEDLGAALRTHRRPKRLSDEQAAIYDSAVAQHIETVEIKALRAYDMGLEMAVRIGMTGPRVDRVQAARDGLAARLGA